MRHLPTGTLTFVFTDIERSTGLLLEDDEGYGASLARQRSLVRGVFGRHGGIEVDTQGDAFFYVFPSARAAVAAVGEAQEALLGILATRMGLHTGEARVTDEGYVGIDVHRAARIAAAAHGGQVLLSQSTRDLVGVEVLDLGSHHLKDLAAAERLYQLGTGDFPPLRTQFRSTLPVPSAPLIGREREISEVWQLVAERSIRLVTLTGAGGSGKTRLAIASANAVVGEFPDGVWWAPLAGVRDAELVMPAIAGVLGTHDVASLIGSGERLLVLDNAEQIASAGTPILELLRSCPNLKILVTSRMRLAVSGEREYTVAPLTESESAELFHARAPGDCSGPVDQVCRRVDCLPLAIELVAARTKTMSVAQILVRLESRLPLLTGGARDAPARQETLRATIDWSYDLLERAEKESFARLSVFAGGFTVETAEEVCIVSPDLVGALADKSLLTLRAGRLRMLETTREYGLEMLQQSGEYDDAHQRLGSYLARIGESSSHARGRDRLSWQVRLTHEIDNLRSVMAWAVVNDPGLALRLVGYADEFGTPQSEWYEWINRSLPYADGVDPSIRARALHAAGYVISTLPDLGTAEFRRAEELLTESLAAYYAADNCERRASVLRTLGHLASLQDEGERSSQLFEESLTLYRADNDALGQVTVLNLLGELERHRGDLPAAKTHLTRALNLARQTEDIDYVAVVMHGLGDVARESQDLDSADGLYEEALRIAPMTRSGRWTVCYCLAGLAAVAGTRGDSITAGQRWGAYETLERTNGLPLYPRDRSKYQLSLTEVDSTAFQVGLADGHAGATDETALSDFLQSL
jgi:predicted ATPase